MFNVKGVSPALVTVCYQYSLITRSESELCMYIDGAFADKPLSSHRGKCVILWTESKRLNYLVIHRMIQRA